MRLVGDGVMRGWGWGYFLKETVEWERSNVGGDWVFGVGVGVRLLLIIMIEPSLSDGFLKNRGLGGL